MNEDVNKTKAGWVNVDKVLCGGNKERKKGRKEVKSGQMEKRRKSVKGCGKKTKRDKEGDRQAVHLPLLPFLSYTDGHFYPHKHTDIDWH
jgi:hypothetical protein